MLHMPRKYESCGLSLNSKVFKTLLDCTLRVMVNGCGLQVDDHCEHGEQGEHREHGEHGHTQHAPLTRGTVPNISEV